MSFIYETYDGEFKAFSMECPRSAASDTTACIAPVSAKQIHLMFIDGLMSKPGF